MKLTFAEKSPKDIDLEVPPTQNENRSATRAPSAGNYLREEKDVFWTRTWIPALTVGMSLLVIISSASVLMKTTVIVESLGTTTTDPVTVAGICCISVAFAVIQFFTGLYQLLQYKYDSLPKPSTISWSIVYLALMSAACTLFFASLANGLQRHSLGFSLVYFSISNAAYLLLAAIALDMLRKK